MTSARADGGPSGNRRHNERSARTRTALIAAAIDEFGDAGFTDATISGISRRAGMAHGSFYTHFASKEEIFREAIRSINAEPNSRRRDDAPAATLEERIERTNRAFFETYRRHARLLASYEELAARDEPTSDLRRATRHSYIEPTVDALRDWQAAGIVDASLDTEALAHCLGSMVERVVHMQIVFGDGCGEERMIAALSHVWSTALGLSGSTPTAIVSTGEDAR